MMMMSGGVCERFSLVHEEHRWSHLLPVHCAPSARGFWSTWFHLSCRCGLHGYWGTGQSLEHKTKHLNEL